MKCVGDCEHVESLGADNQSFYITFSQPWSGKIVIRAYRRDDGDELTAAAEVEVTDRTAVGIPLQSKILSNHVVWTLTARDQGSEREVSGS